MLWREMLSFQNRAWNKQTPVHDTKCEPVLQTKTLICFSNKQKASPQREKREFCCLCVLNAVEKQEHCITWSDRSTYSFTSFGRSFPQELLQPDLFGLGWRKVRPLTRTPASTFNTNMEKEKTNHRAAAATFHFYRLSLRLPPIREGGVGGWLWYPAPLTLLTLKTAARLEKNNLGRI